MWLAGLGSEPRPTLDLTECRRLVVVAAHPDDETLGLGATMAHLVASGVDVQVVSVSDGGAGVPGATPHDRNQLEIVRRHELRRATRVLGISSLVSLGLPDGELSDHEHMLTDELVQILHGTAPGTWCAATWRGDGHPDHEAVGRATAAACARTDVALLEYPIWMWHWARPFDPAVPWDRAYSVPVSNWARVRKSEGAQCFHSQFKPGLGKAPVLPPFVLPRLLAVGEVMFR